MSKNTTWSDIVAGASSSCENKDILQQEFASIVQQAKAFYLKIKKKKGSTPAQ